MKIIFTIGYYVCFTIEWATDSDCFMIHKIKWTLYTYKMFYQSTRQWHTAVRKDVRKNAMENIGLFQNT